jgi:hypothetical protein
MTLKSNFSNFARVVKCVECGARTWMTEEQWRGL